MPGLLSNVDPDGHLEYSVVYSDRALNHMSQSFQQVMRDISSSLKNVYHADAVVDPPLRQGQTRVLYLGGSKFSDQVGLELGPL